MIDNKTKNALENLSLNNIDFSFDANGIERNAIILKNILDNTKKNYLHFSKNFDNEIENNKYFLESLKLFLKRGKNFTLILEKEPNQKSKGLLLLEKYKKSKIIVASNSLIKELGVVFEDREETINFSYSDTNSFRLVINSEENLSVINFNDNNICSSLKKIVKL